MDDKPTLEDLFNTKKLDLPDDEYWDGFQDRVKGKAIASLSHRNRFVRARKAGLYAVLPVFILSLIGWNLISSENQFFSKQPVAHSGSEPSVSDDSLAKLETLMMEEESLSRESAMQLASLDSFDSFTKAQVRLSGGDSYFNHQSLSLTESKGAPAQYTF